jgi:hypothetical protein
MAYEVVRDPSLHKDCFGVQAKSQLGCLKQLVVVGIPHFYMTLKMFYLACWSAEPEVQT